eukprot:COSAG04_NODE_765_length_10500_cov_7.566869_2_plen_67_part_00
MEEAHATIRSLRARCATSSARPPRVARRTPARCALSSTPEWIRLSLFVAQRIQYLAEPSCRAWFVS